jgi:hypothetical protein
MRQFTKLGWLNGKTAKQANPRKNNSGHSFEHAEALRINENVVALAKTEHEIIPVGTIEMPNPPEFAPEPSTVA